MANDGWWVIRLQVKIGIFEVEHEHPERFKTNAEMPDERPERRPG